MELTDQNSQPTDSNSRLTDPISQPCDSNFQPSADSRCLHQFPNGSRCRLDASGAGTRYCSRHAAAHSREEAEELAATLTADLTEFRSLEDVNEFLSRLLLAAAQDRISPRRAAVLAFISSQLLRTISALERERAEAEREEMKHRRVRVICDIPRPPYEKPQNDFAEDFANNLRPAPES